MIVCDPFGGSGGTDKNGLEAQLTYIPANSTLIDGGHEEYRTLTTENFIPGSKDVVVAGATLFLSQVATPTTLFSQGFKDAKGVALKNNSGQLLDEWFSVRAEAEIGATNSSELGDYQFALLSDDGSIMEVNTGNGFQELIDNDGVQANTLGCASRTIKLEAGKTVPVKLNYFQGPRMRISWQLLWRKNPSSLSDPFCGLQKDDEFYFTAQSQPKDPYNALLSRGWKVVPAANFFLNGGKTNPCEKK